MAEVFHELRTAVIWIAFGVSLVFATRPVWSYLMFGSSVTLDDILALRCFGLPT